MALRNPDGTVFKPSGSLQQYNPQNKEFDLLNSFDQELTKISGTPIYYYEIMIQMQTVDKLYLEDRGKLFCPQSIELFAYYDPQITQSPMTNFGIDSTDENIFELNYKETIEKVGHLPKRGSRIYTPHRAEYWIIIETKVANFNYWSQFKLQLICQKWQEDMITGEGRIKQ